VHLTLGAIIWAILAGLVLGLVARFLLPGKQHIPLWLTIVVGIVAAIVGNYIAGLLGVRETHGIDWIRHIIQVVVAMIGVGLVAGLYPKKTSV
jgi:uncharacterized membrane protein YeaQ/YmgE (transglycosylase-associated protein family)